MTSRRPQLVKQYQYKLQYQYHDWVDQKNRAIDDKLAIVHGIGIDITRL